MSLDLTLTQLKKLKVQVIVLRFVQAKSRLKPIKAACTIPRMELMAAEMGLALANKLMATLDIQHHEIFLWTDSRAVHDWLRVESRALQIFVKNRVFENTTIPAVRASHVGPRCVKSGRRGNKGIDGDKAKGSNNLVFGTTVFIPRRGHVAATATRARSRPGKHFTRNNYWFKQELNSSETRCN
jgi:ribonuclease HI